MQTAKGKCVCGGIAIGNIYFLKRRRAAVSRAEAENPEVELRRFVQAQRQAVQQQRTLLEKAKAEAGGEAAAVFEIHAMMLEDADFVGRVRELICSERRTAAYAVEKAVQEQAAAFAALTDNPYMQARSADVRDIGQAVLGFLLGGEPALPPEEPFLLAADDLTPSETMRFDRRLLLGLVTRGGSLSSHTAILARSRNLPALVQCGEVEESWNGRPAALDAGSDRIYLDPEPAVLAELEKRRETAQRQKEQLFALKGKPDVTRDGKMVAVCANIGGPADLPAVLENDACGIGLFRSEFLYLNRETYPAEEEQFAAYREVLQAMAPKKVVVRTCDLGADKTAAYMHLAAEPNPALGRRAVRLCLTNRTLFQTQLRALLRASVFGNLAVMFPLITSVRELRACREVLQECRTELEQQGIRTGQVEVGIMVETPAAVLCAEELAQECDFFSIGTNDLLQYTCALDRQNPNLEPFFDPHHPAVLREIQMTVEAGHRHGCRVSICGELGADLSLTQTFLRMGVDAFSVNPECVLAVRGAARGCDACQRTQ
ncbi:MULTISPECIES: phosphoenolpyruvate--protein phosphotransferase [Caproicibacterium]|uniref:Phosphoenolpyruvate-protein phosphotransferase n=1 Tax=Caproicibacterium argilliputei TaxID=3030016 RepID=A0AA97H233_9FIRM|nr:phosphoenolpyruvate--protein phosphotransferase [Caproicibacterium argilliputei]WOC33166.1 phosphoenolpyruvate--protein phosphotransferase [Caproicibacterium argilliputei]